MADASDPKIEIPTGEIDVGEIRRKYVLEPRQHRIKGRIAIIKRTLTECTDGATTNALLIRLDRLRRALHIINHAIARQFFRGR